MALSDIAAALKEPSAPHRTCQVCHLLDGMSVEDAATLRGLLADRGVKFVDLERELKADDDMPSLHRDALSRHARGLCAAREVLR
jgi:hypothetical protein